jgi:hypothetical protein
VVRVMSRLNTYVLLIFLLDLAICVGLAILGGIFEYQYASDNDYLTVRPALCAHARTHTPHRTVLTLDNLQEDSSGPYIVALKRFTSYFALLSFLIPLSLVVSLEVAKVRFTPPHSATAPPSWRTSLRSSVTLPLGVAGDPIAVHGVGQEAVDQGRSDDRPHLDADR